MNTIVIGPQHSCTRLIVGLVDRHPDVKHVDHMGTFHIDDPKNNHIWNSKVYDKIIIVSRDASCINMSNQKYNIDPKECKAEKTINIINEKINNLLKNNIYKFEDIVFISIESLVQYKEHIVRKLLIQLCLDESKYNYNLNGNYKPNDIHNPDGRWFTVNLDIIDPNKKYITK